MSTIKKMIPTAFWASIALPVAIAAAVPPRGVPRNINSIASHNSHSDGLVTNITASPTTAVSASATTATSDVTAAAAATCTTGASASEQHPSEYPINDYTNIVPLENWESYSVKSAWYNAHYISGPHFMGFKHEEGEFGAFKCQYTCNAAGNCNSFFIWYDNPDTEEEHMNCVLFDAVVPETEFSLSNGTYTEGAYDRLCKGASSN